MTNKKLLKAIHSKCMECTCDQPKEIKLCPCKHCPLWDYRFGLNSYKFASKSDESEGASLSSKDNEND